MRFDIWNLSLRSKAERGSVLGAVMVLMIVLAILTIGAFAYADYEIKTVMRQRWKMQAHHLTEDGFKRGGWIIFYQTAKADAGWTQVMTDPDLDGHSYRRQIWVNLSSSPGGGYSVFVRTTY